MVIRLRLSRGAESHQHPTKVDRPTDKKHEHQSVHQSEHAVDVVRVSGCRRRQEAAHASRLGIAADSSWFARFMKRTRKTPKPVSTHVVTPMSTNTAARMPETVGPSSIRKHTGQASTTALACAATIA